MRWTYIIPRLIIVGLIWAFFAFGFDPLIRQTVCGVIESVTGARADVGAIETVFYPPSLRVRDVQLASRRRPGTNLVEFRGLDVRLAGDPLLHRCFVVDQASLTGVRFGTSRMDDGQLEATEDSGESGPGVPGWLTEYLQQQGDQWLEEILTAAEQTLDPNTLESYRVGQDLYAKWDQQFQDVNRQLQQARREFDSLKKQIDTAKSQRDVAQQVQQYLDIARRTDLLMRQSRDLMTQFRRDVPIELRRDFERLDQAQKNDRARVAQAIQAVKTEPRRITESLLGEHLYGELQNLLSWIELMKRYQQELQAPPPPQRQRGTDFEFAMYNPVPRFLVRRAEIEGQLTLSGMPAPFSAVLTDATSDPRLHGVPSLLKVATRGENPAEIIVRYDATDDVAVTDIGLDYTDHSVRRMAAGRSGRAVVSASLSNLHWVARLRVVEDRIQGRIDLASAMGQPSVEVSKKAAAEVAQLVEQSLSNITSVTATAVLDGSLRRPEIRIESDADRQFSAAFESALAAFLPRLRQQAIQAVDEMVARRKQEFTQKYGTRFNELLADQQQLIDRLQEAHQIAMELRSGRVDADRVFRLASESGLLKEKEQQKAQRYLDKRDRVLKGLQNPEDTIRNALPGLRRKLFE